MAWYFNTNYPWLGMLFCAPISACGTGAPTSTSWQRALGAPDGGLILSGYLGLVFLGAQLIARACSSPPSRPTRSWPS
jgi:hypothetical protein